MSNMENPEGVERLFFDLASESRMAILRALAEKNLKMNDAARKLNLTTTETFRQLQRLSEAMLVQKQPDGTYTITPCGRLTLHVSTSLEFINKYREYFVTHDVLRLPSQFLYRIGEVSGATLRTETMENINTAERITREADKYMWGGGAEHPLDIGSAVYENLPKGVKYRWLFPERFRPKQPMPPEISRVVEWRSLNDIPVNIVLTEKEAGISFCLIGGRADYAGFIGTDPTFLNWVKELFLHYWEKGTRIGPL